MAKKPTSVDEYISSAPKEARPLLSTMRKAIREAAPSATEGISYGMPYYALHGRLAYFRLATHHLGLYIPTPVVEDHKHLLTEYETAKATVRFPLNRRLPVAIIKQLVRDRSARNASTKRSRSTRD